jgi:hypothetical protein
VVELCKAEQYKRRDRGVLEALSQVDSLGTVLSIR